MKAWVRRQFRRKQRIYILPTKMGGYLIGLIFLMFLLSVGYSNNLLLIFTLTLFGFNLMWVVQSHFYLHSLKLQNAFVAHGHAETPLSVEMKWKTRPKGPAEWTFTLESDRGDLRILWLQEKEESSLGELSLPSRGIWKWKYLKVASEKPFGLYRVWTYFPLCSETLGYPKLLKDERLTDLTETPLEGDLQRPEKGQDELRDLTRYQGEESRKISWKHYARLGELLVKEGSDLRSGHLSLTYQKPSSEIELELYLSQMATKMVSCHRQEIPFTFHGPFNKRGPSREVTHVHECLKDLARC